MLHRLWAQGAFTWVVWMWAFVCRSRSMEVDETQSTSVVKAWLHGLWGVTYSAAAGLDSLHGAACAASLVRHVEVGWRTHHGFEAYTSEARHPEELSPAQWGSTSKNTPCNVLTLKDAKHQVGSDVNVLWWSYLSQEFTLLLPHPGLVPQCDLQHPLPELPPVHRWIHKGLVPLGL